MVAARVEQFDIPESVLAVVIVREIGVTAAYVTYGPLVSLVLRPFGKHGHLEQSAVAVQRIRFAEFLS